MWFPNAFWPTLLAAILGAYIIIRLLLSDIRRPGNFSAFVMFLAFFIWSLGEMVERLAGPPPDDKWLAWFGAQFLFVGIALAPAGFIHFSLDYPDLLRIKGRKGIITLFYLISLVFAVLGIFNPNRMIIADMEPYRGLGQMIWGIVSSRTYNAYVSYVFAMSLVFMFIMIYRYFRASLHIIKMQISISLAGFIIAVAMVSSSYFVQMIFGGDSYPLTTVSFSIFSLFVLYTIHRYRAFLVYPEEHGNSYEAGLKILKREDAERLFADALKKGSPALAFISTDLSAFKKKLGKDIPAFRISGEKGPDNLNPLLEEHIEMLYFIILSFAEQAGGAVVLIEIKDAMKKMERMDRYGEMLDEFEKMSSSHNISFIIAE